MRSRHRRNSAPQAVYQAVRWAPAFYFDGSASAGVWEDTDSTSLAPGASSTLMATGGTTGANYWIATAGSHSVTAWVDDVNRIAESNESNNKLTEDFSVSASSTLAPVVQIDAGSGSGVVPFTADVGGAS